MRNEQRTSVWVRKYLSQGGKEIKRLTERMGKNCEYLKIRGHWGIRSVFIVEIALLLLTKNLFLLIMDNLSLSLMNATNKNEVFSTSQKGFYVLMSKLVKKGTLLCSGQ